MKLSDVYSVTGGVLSGDAEFKRVCYDSRKAAPGDLFVCLRGERTDGHRYIGNAFESGCAAVLCEKVPDISVPYLVVPDSLKAMQQYATERVRELGIRTVAVTGSVGKTTTKEFIYSVLSSSLPVFAAKGNLNSDIGLPAVMIGIEETYKYFVAEMGMSNFGEISLLSKIARPDVAVITNIGYCHLEFLKTRENILKAKLEITDGMTEDGILILNGDDEYLRTVKNVRQRVIRYGIDDPECSFRAINIREDGKTVIDIVTPSGIIKDVCVPAEGRHNIYNVLAAVAVGDIYSLSESDIRIGLESFSASPMRQHIFEHKGITVIEDCYNASPTSMLAAFSVLRRYGKRKIAVLGDMLELGENSSLYHEQTGKALEGIDILIVQGEHSADIIRGAEQCGIRPECCFTAEDTDDAFRILTNVILTGDAVLFKASRGMAFERIVNRFTGEF